IAAGMRLEERLPEGIRRDRERRKSRAWKLSGIARACGFKKRRRKQLIHLKQIGQGQDVEDSEAAGNCGLAITERIPGKSRARLEVQKRGIRNQRISQMRSGVVKVAENRQLALNLSNDRGHFVAQPQIDGEVRAPAPIVLSIGSQNGLTNAARADGTRDGRAQRDGVVGEEAGERIEKELTVWTA